MTGGWRSYYAKESRIAYLNFWYCRLIGCQIVGLQAHRLSSDFSTDVAFKANLHLAVWVENDGDRVSVEQGFVQGILALVHPALLIFNALPTPRVA